VDGAVGSSLRCEISRQHLEVARQELALTCGLRASLSAFPVQELRTAIRPSGERAGGVREQEDITFPPSPFIWRKGGGGKGFPLVASRSHLCGTEVVVDASDAEGRVFLRVKES
jgi:hypothetical protein